MTTTILIVDDGAVNRRLLRAELESAGYHVIEAAQGIEGLRTIELDPLSVGLIITDLLMPEMDGFQFSNAVRTDPRFELIPILVYTATYDSPTDEKFALEAGADRYLLKPAPAARLLKIVHELLTKPEYRQPRNTPPLAAPRLIKSYNAVLVGKLEDRTRDLEQVNIELRAANADLRTLRDQLEIRIHERTVEVRDVASGTRRCPRSNQAIDRIAAHLLVLPQGPRWKGILDECRSFHGVALEGQFQPQHLSGVPGETCGT